jgi:hypothetical protein
LKNWFKKEDYSDYKLNLTQSFPSELHNQLNDVFAVIPFNDNKTKNFYKQEYTVSGLISEDSFEILLNNKKLQIPYRVYFNEPNREKESKLNQTQKDILNCIYTRHHNGKVRQESLEKLKNNNSYWSAPFRIQLLGEYVYQIYETLSIQLNDIILDNCKRFLEENPKFAKKTENRIISYYGIFYRWEHPKFKNYLCKDIFYRINQKYIGVNQEELTQIGLNDKNQLFLKPKNKSFSMIYRLAKGINWDNLENTLHSMPIDEWSKYKWYLHILNTIYKECGIELIPTKKTEYINLDRKSQNQIQQNKKRPHNNLYKT